MTGTKALVGAATRYIAGRNAVQTVYWRSKESGGETKMIKVSKTLQLGKKATNASDSIQTNVTRSA